MEMLGMVVLIVFGGVAVIALLAAIHLLLPGAVEKVQGKLDGSLGRAFLVGLVNVVFFGAAAVLLTWLATLIRDYWSGFAALLAGVLGLVVVVMAAGLAALALNGLSALAALLGERMGEAKTPFRGDLRGGLLLALACLTPYLGWFAFAPFALCLAVGGSVLALFQRKVRLPAEA